jgi:hypothetical protein
MENKKIPTCKDCLYNNNYTDLSNDGFFKKQYHSFCGINSGNVVSVPYDRQICRDFKPREDQ